MAVLPKSMFVILTCSVVVPAAGCSCSLPSVRDDVMQWDPSYDPLIARGGAEELWQAHVEYGLLKRVSAREFLCLAELIRRHGQSADAAVVVERVHTPTETETMDSHDSSYGFALLVCEAGEAILYYSNPIDRFAYGPGSDLPVSVPTRGYRLIATEEVAAEARRLFRVVRSAGLTENGRLWANGPGGLSLPYWVIHVYSRGHPEPIVLGCVADPDCKGDDVALRRTVPATWEWLSDDNGKRDKPGEAGLPPGPAVRTVLSSIFRMIRSQR